MIAVTVLIYLPLVNTGWQSLTGTLGGGFSRKQGFVGMANYQRMIDDGSLSLLVRNSLVWTILVVVGQNVLGFAMALLMSPRWQLSGLLRALLVLPWVIPGVVGAVLWGLMYDPQLGLIASILQRVGVGGAGAQMLSQPQTAMIAVSLAAIWKGFPFSFILYLAALTTVDRNLVEAARIDGAGTVGLLRHVIVPAVLPVIQMGLLLTSIFTFNYFDLIWITTRGGPLNATHIFPTMIFQTGFGNFNFGLASAYGVVAFVMLLVLLVPYLHRVWITEKEAVR
ncbi:carbohydrate ABC transporter permease [Propionibacteriaceae bacterium Y2011]